MFYYINLAKNMVVNYFQPGSFVKEIATEIFDRGFFGQKKPDVVLYGHNEHFIIGCTLGDYEETQKLSFLKDQPGLNEDKHYEPNDDQAPPQLIFSVDYQSLFVELKVFSPPVEDLINLWWKGPISKEEMFKMLEEIRDTGIDLYPA